jgi:hypothetical protein
MINTEVILLESLQDAPNVIQSLGHFPLDQDGTEQVSFGILSLKRQTEGISKASLVGKKDLKGPTIL